MESNHRLHAYKTCSLTTELLAHRKQLQLLPTWFGQGESNPPLSVSQTDMQMPLQYGQHKQKTTYVVSVVGLEPTASSVRERASAADLHTDGAGDGSRTHMFFFTGEAYLPLYYTSKFFAQLSGIEPESPTGWQVVLAFNTIIVQVGGSVRILSKR